MKFEELEWRDGLGNFVGGWSYRNWVNWQADREV